MAIDPLKIYESYISSLRRKRQAANQSNIDLIEDSDFSDDNLNAFFDAYFKEAADNEQDPVDVYASSLNLDTSSGYDFDGVDAYSTAVGSEQPIEQWMPTTGGSQPGGSNPGGIQQWDPTTIGGTNPGSGNQITQWMPEGVDASNPVTLKPTTPTDPTKSTEKTDEDRLNDFFARFEEFFNRFTPPAEEEPIEENPVNPEQDAARGILDDYTVRGKQEQLNQKSLYAYLKDGKSVADFENLLNDSGYNASRRLKDALQGSEGKPFNANDFITNYELRKQAREDLSSYLPGKAKEGLYTLSGLNKYLSKEGNTLEDFKALLDTSGYKVGSRLEKALGNENYLNQLNARQELGEYKGAKDKRVNLGTLNKYLGTEGNSLKDFQTLLDQSGYKVGDRLDKALGNENYIDRLNARQELGDYKRAKDKRINIDALNKYLGTEGNSLEDFKALLDQSGYKVGNRLEKALGSERYVDRLNARNALDKFVVGDGKDAKLTLGSYKDFLAVDGNTRKEFKTLAKQAGYDFGKRLDNVFAGKTSPVKPVNPGNPVTPVNPGNGGKQPVSGGAKSILNQIVKSTTGSNKITSDTNFNKAAAKQALSAGLSAKQIYSYINNKELNTGKGVNKILAAAPTKAAAVASQQPLAVKTTAKPVNFTMAAPAATQPVAAKQGFATPAKTPGVVKVNAPLVNTAVYKPAAPAPVAVSKPAPAPARGGGGNKGGGGGGKGGGKK